MKSKLQGLLQSSARIILLVIAIYACCVARIANFKKNIVVHDIIYYYSYLPAYFIKHDLKLDFLAKEPAHQNRYWHNTAPNGGKVFKMSMGIAYLYAPFFLLGHIAAIATGSVQDGFSLPYQIFLAFSSVFYVFIGFLLVRKVLMRYFDEITVSFVILLLGLGTNLMYYVINEGPMSHAYNFFLFSAALYLTIRWHEHASLLRSILLGFSLGLIVLARPSNAPVILIPLLYNIYNKQSLLIKIKYITNYWYMLIPLVFAAAIVFVPQLYYWKLVTGQWFFYSYVGEKFFFNNPHILETFLSWRKGLFIYTPVMLFSYLGLLLLHKYAKHYLLMILAFMAVHIFIVSSWWCWWYGGSFGLRAYIDSYPIMALPLAAFIEYFRKHKIVFWRYKTWIGFGFLVLLNLFQTRQYIKGIIHYDSMTRKAYIRLLGKNGCPPDYWSLLKTPDLDKALKGQDEYKWD